MIADVFFFTETNARPWAEQVERGAKTVRVVLVDYDTDDVFNEIVAAARAAGVGKGSSRSGIFEIQTDDGVFINKDVKVRERGYGRLTDRNVVFVPWDEFVV